MPEREEVLPLSGAFSFVGMSVGRRPRSQWLGVGSGELDWAIRKGEPITQAVFCEGFLGAERMIAVRDGRDYHVHTKWTINLREIGFLTKVRQQTGLKRGSVWLFQETDELL